MGLLNWWKKQFNRDKWTVEKLEEIEHQIAELSHNYDRRLRQHHARLMTIEREWHIIQEKSQLEDSAKQLGLNITPEELKQLEKGFERGNLLAMAPVVMNLLAKNPQLPSLIAGIMAQVKAGAAGQSAIGQPGQTPPVEVEQKENGSSPAT